jgi:hypothetical protein
MNFTIANMIGAIDKRFELKYNYLISLLSKKITDMEYIPPFTDLTLLNSFTNDPSTNKFGYRKVGKTVYFRGSVQNGESGAVLAELPTGYFPLVTSTLSCYGIDTSETIDGLIRVKIYDNGYIVPLPILGDGESWSEICFDGLSFQLD